MDEQRFDRLARGVAAVLSRRRVVGVLLAFPTVALATGARKSVGAQATPVEVGGECIAAVQCRQIPEGDPVLCDENGTGDGVRRCCMTGL